MKTIQLAVLMLVSSIFYAQIPTALNVQTFTNFNYPDIEPNFDYQFGYPVYANFLNPNENNYQLSIDNRYFTSLYGPRHKFEQTSNIGYFDFHKGSDIAAEVTFGTTTYGQTNSPDIHCACNGKVTEIFTGPNVENTGSGIYVMVECDDIFQANPSWGKIFTAYRHLASVPNNLYEGGSVSKGEVVGVMGETGYTETVHLHFSVIRYENGKQINVHPMRVFKPSDIPHLLSPLVNAEITQLYHNSNEALFRLAIPYNMVNIRAIEVSLENGTYSKVYDFEEVSKLSQEERDDNDAVNDLELFAYPFNRGKNAYRRFWNRVEDEQIPIDYPASPENGVGNFHPFLSEGLFQTPAYVMDIKALNLPAGYDIDDLTIKILDIWGNGVEANGVIQDPTQHIVWSMIQTENDDVEEYHTGTMSMGSSDLELVYDGSHGNQKVGLIFRDLEIPNSVTITDAFIQFRADATHNGTTNLVIKAEDSGTVADFSNTSNNVSNRNTTDAYLNWSPSQWTEEDMKGAQKCGNLGGLVQEVVTRQDWTEDSPLNFIITGTGRREAEGYSSSSLWKNAYVCVTYYDEIATMPNEAPSISLAAPIDGTEFAAPTTITLSAIATDPNDNLIAVEFYVNNNYVGTVDQFPYELDYDLPDYGLFTVQAIAIDEDGLTANSDLANIHVRQHVLDIQIKKSSDDVEEVQNGKIWKSNSDLELCYDDLVSNSVGLVGHQYIGLRFKDIDIPQGAVITRAYVQFTVDETNSEDTEIIIRAEDTDSAMGFSYTTNDVSNRTMTSDSVTWNPAPWTNTGDSGINQQTSDISPLVQTVVNRSGWANNDDLVIILYSWNQLKRVAESYDGSPAGAPVLHIEFTDNTSTSMFMMSINDGDKGLLDPLDIEKIDARIFPNPVVSQSFNVVLDTPIFSNTYVEILDTDGRIQAMDVIVPHDLGALQFSSEGWAAGTYFVRIRDKKKVISIDKLIVQ